MPSEKRRLLSSSYIDSLKANLRVYMRILGLLRPHRLVFIGAIVGMALSTGLSLIVPWLLAWVVDVGVRYGRLNDLLVAAAAILGTSALRGLFAYGQGYWSQALSNLVAYDLRGRIYEHLQTMDFAFHDESETGQLMSNMTVDIEAVRNFFPMGLLRALLAVTTFVTVSAILLWLDWRLALVTLISVPILVVLAAQVSRRLRPLWLQAQNEIGELGTVMQESLSGVRVVKAFAREDFEIQKYERQNLKLRELNMSAMRLSAWNQPLMVLALNIITVIVIWIGGAAVINRQLSLGTLVAVTQYIFLLASPVRSFGFMVNWFLRALSGGTRIFAVLDARPKIKDAPAANQATAKLPIR
jgi:ABC-type multidrug transport system fused ATPase/permease subunit